MNDQENSKRNNSAGANHIVDIDALVTGLKKEDVRNLKMAKNFRWFLMAMTVFYTLLMVVNPDPELMVHHRISGLCYVTAFALFAIVFTRLYREFRDIDYSVSSAEMLEQAAKRYKFATWRYIWVMPSLVLVDAGLTISYFYRLTSFEPLERILLVQAFFIPVIVTAGFIGHLIWRKRQKPLYDSALQLLQELQ